LEGKGVGTRFVASPEALSARKRWIAFGRKVRGALHLDEGAVRALTENKRSLLPSGIKRVEGAFNAGDTVKVVTPEGRELARGLTVFNASDLKKIQGRRSAEIEPLLGRPAPAEVIHRNNLVLL
jgi:glutamate 5-kinase